MKRRIQDSLTPLLAWVIRGTFELLWKTIRIEEFGETLASVERRHTSAFLAAFWHGRLLYPAWRYQGPRYAAMVDLHRDGELLVRSLRILGTRCIRGSRLHRRNEVMFEALAVLREGVSLALTPDGPIGPERKAQLGAVALASASGAPLIPLAWSVRRFIVLRSWDRLMIPLPFTRGVQVAGTPIWVPKDLSIDQLEEWRIELEQQLELVTDEADRRARSC